MLLLATLVFFPVFIVVLILDTLFEDMPTLRAAVKRVCQTLGAWIHVCFRMPDLRGVARKLALPEMAAPDATPTQS